LFPTVQTNTIPSNVFYIVKCKLVLEISVGNSRGILSIMKNTPFLINFLQMDNLMFCNHASTYSHKWVTQNFVKFQ